MASPLPLLILLLATLLPESHAKTYTSITFQPWKTTNCTGLNNNLPLNKPVILEETFRDKGVCHKWDGEGQAFKSFSYKREDRTVIGTHEQQGMCILEVYQGMLCGTRQPELIETGYWDSQWEFQKPLMVIHNATAPANMDKCYHLLEEKGHKGRSVFFDCRKDWGFRVDDIWDR